jgi:HK97 gp10 family phage protein
MAVTRIQVSGLRELEQRMKKLASDVAIKAARSATAAAAAVVKKAAQDNIRKSPSIQTGSLLASVIVKRLGKSETNLTSEHIVTVRGRGKKRPYTAKGKRIETAPHAHFVEFGTVNMPAEPFLRPAIEQNVQKAIDVMADKLRQRIEKAGE